MTSKRWLAATLGMVSGGVHFYLYFTQSLIPFLLAGLGFVTLTVLLSTTFDHRLLYLGDIPFTLQIAAWIRLSMPNFMIGVAKKTVRSR